jgi:hypothetical protein
MAVKFLNLWVLMQHPIPVSGVTTTALIMGVVNSAPRVASIGAIPGGGTTASTNPPIHSPLPGVTTTALISGAVNSAPCVASGGEISGGDTTAATNSDFVSQYLKIKTKNQI